MTDDNWLHTHAHSPGRGGRGGLGLGTDVQGVFQTKNVFCNECCSGGVCMCMHVLFVCACELYAYVFSKSALKECEQTKRKRCIQRKTHTNRHKETATFSHNILRPIEILYKE